jgi:hypothetical protein
VTQRSTKTTAMPTIVPASLIPLRMVPATSHDTVWDGVLWHCALSGAWARIESGTWIVSRLPAAQRKPRRVDPPGGIAVVYVPTTVPALLMPISAR